jgi:hypothetical protein
MKILTTDIKSEPELRLILVRAPDDPPLSSPAFQKELSDFARSLRGIQVEPICFAADSMDGGGGLSGEFILIVKNVAPVITVIAAAAGAYIHAKYGRKVKVEFDGVKVEASSPEEAEKLIKMVEEHRKKIGHK